MTFLMVLVATIVAVLLNVRFPAVDACPIGIIADAANAKVFIWHAAPVAISTAPPTVLQIPCVFTYNRNVSLTFYLFHQKNENCYLYKFLVPVL